MRVKAEALYGGSQSKLTASVDELLKALEEALYFSTIMAYAQGMHLLSQASVEFKYDLKIDRIARIWRGGCIIRSSFLEDIYQAFKNDGSLTHLLLDKNVQLKVSSLTTGTRLLLTNAINSGIALPAFTAALSYFDSFRSGRMPSNLIQAQRDYFGAHTYELIGKEGTFHSQWFAK